LLTMICCFGAKWYNNFPIKHANSIAQQTARVSIKPFVSQELGFRASGFSSFLGAVWEGGAGGVGSAGVAGF
jgi:hypothetical protein